MIKIAAIDGRAVLGFLCVVVLMTPSTARAQHAVSVGADLLFYGDNTEFRNDFREGDTTLGTASRAVVNVDLGSNATVTGGVFGNRRFGSEHFFDTIRPVMTLEFGSKTHRFVFGTLSVRKQPAFGADRAGPHGLLPPIQIETLSFTRPYEAGIQWTYRSGERQHELWINWQRLDTPAHRELFDAGVVGQFPIAGPVAAAYQVHIVHQGGQVFRSGAVTDSNVVAPGVVVNTSVSKATRVSVDGYVVGSKYVPDRQFDALKRTGTGVFGRAAVLHGPWRAHALGWRSRDYVKVEGDPNYASVAIEGDAFRPNRTYAEAGITRIAHPTEPLSLEGSIRLHRVDGTVDYSFRMLGHVELNWPIKRHQP